MDLQERINLMAEIGERLNPCNEAWQEIRQKAFQKNGWFIPDFIQYAADRICSNFLNRDNLQAWVEHYHIDDNIAPKNTGIVMAGNIPLVGFQDFLAVFVSGHHQTIKLSSKDDVLLKYIVGLMSDMNAGTQTHISFAEMLKGCDAYIATGSNNTGRYFEQYFGKYPNIIRRNRTSVAILNGTETAAELSALADDIHLYFGLGCRNVTKIYIPEGYDFVPLLASFEPYRYFADHHKHKNNYDYQLSLLLLNYKYYMTDGQILLTENTAYFSPISQLHYEFYPVENNPLVSLREDESLQCIVAKDAMPFGSTQHPQLMDYADGVDTMQFLLSL